ncbi:MAG TPA: hypothetical protein VHZ09_20445 [Acidobacteriaceae bacterium]|jgi:hypothetical protein|nr:hypothetical protein [Acidobacteriaceae bacterium]
MKADDRLRLIRVKIERSEKHLDELEAAILSLGEVTFKTISLEYEPGTGKPRMEFRPLHVYGPDIPAIAGDVIHNLRCALDHLAYHLVTVGITFGERRTENWADIQFPIFHSEDSYKAGKGRRIQGMRREAIEAIDRVKPYKGGTDALWLLRKLDNTDKHSFIIATGEDVIVGGVPLKTYEPYFASLGIPKGNQDVNLSSQEALVEPAVGRANALLPTLHKLTELVSHIVTDFLPLLRDKTGE